MKVKVNNQKDFEPIELTITIESKYELNNLYARINASHCDIENFGYVSDWTKGERVRVEITDQTDLYNTIQSLCERHFK